MRTKDLIEEAKSRVKKGVNGNCQFHMDLEICAQFRKRCEEMGIEKPARMVEVLFLKFLKDSKKIKTPST